MLENSRSRPKLFERLFPEFDIPRPRLKRVELVPAEESGAISITNQDSPDYEPMVAGGAVNIPFTVADRPDLVMHAFNQRPSSSSTMEVSPAQSREEAAAQVKGWFKQEVPHDEIDPEDYSDEQINEYFAYFRLTGNFLISQALEGNVPPDPV